MATATAKLKTVETNTMDVAEFMRLQGAKAQEGANVRLTTCVEFGKRCATKEWTSEEAPKAARAYEEGFAAKAGFQLAAATTGPLESKLRAFANPAVRTMLDDIVKAYDAAKATRSKKDMGDKDAFSGVYAVIARINKLAKESKPIPEVAEGFILEAVGAATAQTVDDSEEGKAAAKEAADKLRVIKIKRALFDIAADMLGEDTRELLPAELIAIAKGIRGEIIDRPKLPKA